MTTTSNEAEQSALVDLLYRQSRAVLFANFVIPIPVVGVLWPYAPAMGLLAWAGAVYLATAARLALSLAYARRATPARSAVWAWRFAVGSSVSSALWGWIGWAFYQPEQPQLVAFTCIVIAGLSSGTIASFAAFPPAAAAAQVLLILPFVSRSFADGHGLAFVYGAFALCLFCVNLYYSRVTYLTLIDSVRLRFANTALIGQLRVERDRAEAANLAKSRFLAAASHDLRQPVHALGLFASALGTLAQRGDVAQTEGRLIAAKLSAVLKSLGGLLHGLLDISRLDAGIVQPEPRALAVTELFAALRHEFADAAQAKALDLRSVPSRCWIRSDPLLLRRILDNVLSNAIRYTPRGGILVGCRRRGDALEIQVWDTGIGIARDQHEAIFHEFAQVDNPQRDREQGLGLGLAIAQRAAGLLGHALGVRSVPGRGSMFWVRVPLCAAPAPSVPATPAATARGIARGVIVVDDDAQVLDALSYQLRTWGCAVYAGLDAERARHAHEAARRHGDAPVDLIIADYRLAGGVHGAQAIRQLVDYLGTPVPAAIVTGDTSPERLREARASGYRLLHKPVAAEQLRELVEQSALAARV
ncbi:hybrid sensor histidine kinase/response regulator [Dokdonella sp.]|uniref:hybrid sensor histidine kinase/response regulator n=1 Tax=Dokdonella sp. TaxID=2291710 RepID=UPI001B11EFA7|nr:hybrid sensor histidine kinase/response regulator [Dokdonella sp.]MBO9662539.1 response regulator [Dokdonella sp.]